MNDDVEQVEAEIDPIIEAAKEKAQQGAEFIESQKTQAETASESAKAANVTAEESAQASKTYADQAKASLDEINALLAQVKTNREEVLSLSEKIKTDSAATAEIARTADEKDAKVDEYEKQLESLRTESEELKQQIEKLLPAATSTGLAKAFEVRKKSFTWPIRGALALFLLSVLGFIMLGVVAFNEDSIKSLTDFLLYALRRSPIIAGLVVLEEFSRRQYKTLRKLEEDYAYKETVSRTFEGYRDAMQKISATEDTPVKTLSDNVLDAIAQPPGRLYDGEDDRKSLKKDEDK